MFAELYSGNSQPNELTFCARQDMSDLDLARVLEHCLHPGTGTRDWEAFVRDAQPVIASAVLRALARRATANSALADDLIQDCFLKMCVNDFRVLRNFRGYDVVSLRAYLRTIAATVVADYFKSKHAKHPVDLDDVVNTLGTQDTTADDLDRQVLLEHVDKCLASRDDRSRKIFWLYHLKGLSPRLIAEQAGVDIGISGVETAIYRLTKAVKECLERAGLLAKATIGEGGRA